MRFSIFAMAAAVAASAFLAVPAAAEPICPSVSLDRIEYNFGNIAAGSKGEGAIRVTNASHAPLVLTSVQSSGSVLTVTAWPKEPIAPSASAQIRFKYDTKKVGAFAKFLTITANCEPSVFRIPVTGVVDMAKQ